MSKLINSYKKGLANHRFSTMTSGNPSVQKPAAPPAPGWPIRFSIASVVVVAMLVLAVAVLALGSYGSRQNAIANATKTAREATAAKAA